jgi:hypothetical protein
LLFSDSEKAATTSTSTKGSSLSTVQSSIFTSSHKATTNSATKSQTAGGLASTSNLAAIPGSIAQEDNVPYVAPYLGVCTKLYKWYSYVCLQAEASQFNRAQLKTFFDVHGQFPEKYRLEFLIFLQFCL